MESSPIRGISTDTESQIRDGEGEGRGREREVYVHAPFRRVMKRPASDMTRESNCVYNRGRSRLYSRPSWYSASFRRRSDDPSTSFRLSHRPPHWHGPADDNVAYSNFIVGPFGIPVDGPRAPFDPSSPRRLGMPGRDVAGAFNVHDRRWNAGRRLLIRTGFLKWILEF